MSDFFGLFSVTSPLPCTGRWGNRFEISGQVDNSDSAAVAMWVRYTEEPGVFTALGESQGTTYDSGSLWTAVSGLGQSPGPFKYELKARLQCPNLPSRTLTESAQCDLKTTERVGRRGTAVYLGEVSRTVAGDKDYCFPNTFTFSQTHSVASTASGAFDLGYLSAQLQESTTSTISLGHKIDIPARVLALIYVKELQEDIPWEEFHYDWLGQPGVVEAFGTLHHKVLVPTIVPYDLQTCQ